MAMDHSTCDHPRTPKGRAWCRANGGPGSGAVWGSLPENDPSMVAARAGRKTPAAPRQVAVKVVATPDAPITTPRTRGTGSDILATLPGVFRAAADWAVANSCLVTTSTVKDQQMVHLTNKVGRVTLTWRPATPDGVWRVSFKPDASSITSQVATVNEALAMMRG
jgi:hypothetical protein